MTAIDGMLTSRTIDAKELPEPIDWVVPDFAARGHLTILAGQAGVGKTQLALQLAAQAGAPETPSLYLDIENGPSQLRRLAAAMALDDAVDLVDMHGLALTEADTLDTLNREILGRNIAGLARHGRMGAPLVVLDSLRRFAPGLSENSSDDMAPYVTGIANLARVTQVAVVLIHHASSKADAAALRGSSAIEDQADIVFTLTAARDGLLRLAPTQKFRLGGRPAPSFYMRREEPLRLEASQPASRALKRQEYAERILDLLAAEGALSRSELASRLGRPQKDGTVGNALEDLQYGGSIARREDGAYALGASCT